MRGPLFAFSLVIGVAAAGAASAALRVQRLAPPDAHRPTAVTPGALPMRPDELAAWRAHVEAWNGFRDIVTAPSVDWSPRAMRRKGWHAPTTPLPDAHAIRPARIGDVLPPPDTLRVAFIRIDFLNDRGGSESSGDGRFDLSGPDPNVPPIDRPPHNRTFYEKHLDALGRYYFAQTYGRVQIVGDVWPRDQNSAYSVSDMADFGPWKFSRNIYDAAVHMFRTFITAADSQSFVRGDRIPWDSYDRIILIHAGSDLQSDVRQDSKLDIPTFTLGVEDSSAVRPPAAWPSAGQPPAGFRPIDRCTFIPETINQDGYFGTLNGVFAHESGHLDFGFEDLYDIETGRPIVGLWSLMDSGNLAGSRILLPDSSEIFATGLLPPSVDPWQRFYCTDVLNFPEVGDGNLDSLMNGERHPDMRRVTLSSDEYLLLENRHVTPSPTVALQQDSLTHVILAPAYPDSLEYDALLPGSGILVWHIDTSVIPFTTSLRINPDYGFNTNPLRLAISVVEADGLGDLGDPGSPYIIGAPWDPWFKSVNTTLADTTKPNLVPHIGTRPHRRIDFLDDPDTTMHFIARRAWQLPGWPIQADVPPGGPMLLAADVDGDGKLEVCWAGGADSIVVGKNVVADPDSAALFAVRFDGSPLAITVAGGYSFAHVDRRPRPMMASATFPGAGALFAVSTYAAGPDTSSPGGRVWLLDHTGTPLPGWPAVLPSIVTTPPVIVSSGTYPNFVVFVGCADGNVYPLGVNGTAPAGLSPLGALAGGVSGRLAANGVVSSSGSVNVMVAAGGADGDVSILQFCNPCPLSIASSPQRVGGPGFAPDFLWIPFDGATPPVGRAPICPGTPGSGGAQLVAHYADKLWAFCQGGNLIPGWGHSAGDTLVDALGAGDPDGDGFPEVLTQSIHSGLAFWNASGYPSPGWPKRGTTEDLRTTSAPLALDVNGDGRSEVIGLNGSGVIAALDRNGKTPSGWPLATGSGAVGAPVAADLDGDGSLDVVAPDRFGMLYAYTLPVSGSNPVATSWTTLGGDPGRTFSLPASRASTAPASAPGPLVSGSLKVYPNPARRRPVSFAYTLTEPATVEFKILDTSGHEVASFTRQGIQSDNVQVWDPGKLPAGLYLARMHFKGASSDRTEVLSVGLIR